MARDLDDQPGADDPRTPVVFISQLDHAGSRWQPVIDRLTSRAPTVTYDRPGSGSAPPRPAPNPAIPYSVFADELAAVLDERGVTVPAVLVGHSVGSLIARAFAARHPDRVAGMVHVDGSIPRLHLVVAGEPIHDGDGPDATEIDTYRGEVEILRAGHATVPTAVIARTPGLWDVPLPHPAIDDIWTIYQQRLAADSGGLLVVAKNAGHQVPREAPELVAHVIDAVLRAAQQDTPVGFDRGALAAAGGDVGYDSSTR